MTIFKRSVLFGIIAAMMAAILFGCTGDKADHETDKGYYLTTDGKLTIAASLDFPPFENLEGNQPVGFTVELMDMIAKEMGLEPNYLSSVKFDAIAPMISAGGKADVGVSSFTITEERKKEIDFTDPYCDSNQGLVVLLGSEYKLASDLEGKKVGAQSGTTGYDWSIENIKDADVIAFDEMTAVFAALQSGQVEGIVVDLPVAQYYVDSAYVDCTVVQKIPTGEQYGIVVSKENPELTKALNDALATLRSNGEYDKLYKKWFD